MNLPSSLNGLLLAYEKEYRVVDCFDRFTDLPLLHCSMCSKCRPGLKGKHSDSWLGWC